MPDRRKALYPMPYAGEEMIATSKRKPALPKLTNKFSAKRETVDGHSFASKAESRRYRELKLMQAAGQIHSLEFQPQFTFPFRARYTADFAYHQIPGGDYIVEEIKGVRTEAFNLRLKCFHFFFPTVKLLINGVDSRAKKTRRRTNK